VNLLATIFETMWRTPAGTRSGALKPVSVAMMWKVVAGGAPFAAAFGAGSMSASVNAIADK